MCGITGIYAFNDKGKSFFPEIEKAIQALNKRGPDNQGIYINQNVALGHTRLSIIDVSESASQPFLDETQRYVIVYNGEIYNFKQLKQELINKGQYFKSNSDTEVLLKLYILNKEKCLDRLQGFFAFAIYDKETEELFIARDRIGIKPLLIYKDSDKLIFASEMKAIMAYNINLTLDYTSLLNYLQLNYIPAPDSIFKEVKKITPGSWLRLKGKEFEKECYYNIPAIIDNNNYNNISMEQASQQLETLLEQSVTKRLVSDVPLGAFLSGGIDSSIIVALAAKQVKNLNTFTIGFKDEPLFDETYYARLVSEKYNTNHTEFSLTTDDIFNEFYNILNYIDEPYGDSSALAVYILSKNTRNHVTVALSGDGADELFGGYNKHLAEYYARKFSAFSPFLKLASPLWNILPKSRNTKYGNIIRQLKRFTNGISLPEKERYWRWCAFTNVNEALSLLNQPVALSDFKEKQNKILSTFTSNGDLNQVLYADMHLVLQNDMLVKVDLMSMANSIEVRVPYLDHELVNFMFSLPYQYKINNRKRKIILLETFGHLLPDQLLNRSKHGFEVPLLKWFRTDLKNLIENDLLSETFIKEQKIFNYNEILKLKNKLFSSNPDESVARIYGLIVFQYWYKKYLANR